jgi:hypothetical protein
MATVVSAGCAPADGDAPDASRYEMYNDNVIELSRVPVRPRSRTADKRVHPRLESNDRLFAQVVLAPEQPTLLGHTLACRAVNFSIGGVQFTAAAPLPAGTLLDLWIDASSTPGKFFLSGEVRWTRAGGPNGLGEDIWYVGVQLRPGPATDYHHWREYLSRAITA